MYLIITCTTHDSPVEASAWEKRNNGQLHWIETSTQDAHDEITEIRYTLDLADVYCPTVTDEPHHFVVGIFDDDDNWLANAE
jgi:hypothetical protein